MEKSNFPSTTVGKRWICHTYLQMYTEIGEKGMSLQAIRIVWGIVLQHLLDQSVTAFAALIFNEHSTFTNAIKKTNTYES